MDFLKSMESIANARTPAKTRTENGALGYKNTYHPILDMNFRMSSYRQMVDEDIIKDFRMAFKDDPDIALKWLFYARDVLQGAGERRLFRIIARDLAIHRVFPQHLVQYVPAYGRWDDLLCFVNTPMWSTAMKVIRDQLTLDLNNYNNNKPFSLLAKWLPSVNASSDETRQLGRMIAHELGCSERTYRKMLAAMRARLEVVEQSLTAQEWATINYEHVPARANLIYNDAFLRHDTARRSEFLAKAVKGEVKVNAKTLTPYDIVNKYVRGSSVSNTDINLETAWKNLPTNFDVSASTIVCADGSYSMYGGSPANPIAVAVSLAIYFSERLSGPYKDRYITFSHHPRFVDLSKCTTLRDKIREAFSHNECENTNVEAVFDLVLRTAQSYHLTQAEMPAQVLIISDMEFDRGTDVYNQKTLFESIGRKFTLAGYKLPRLIFWNVCSRTNAVPMQENENGLVLISGYSPNAMKCVMSGKLDPYGALLDVLNSARYELICRTEKKTSNLVYTARKENTKAFMGKLAHKFGNAN